MNATEAIDQLDPQKWTTTSPAERLRLLEEIRANLKKYGDDLAFADSKMKNGILGAPLFSYPMSKVATVVPMASTVSAAIILYESILDGKMPQPLSVEKVSEDLYDIYVFPQERKDKLMYADQKSRIRVKGAPKQINPMEKPAGIIAVLGAGNYSSALEVLKAIFFENCAVVHKPHHLNEETDRIWAKIMQPLIERRVLSFCDTDRGHDLTVDPRLSRIYFTGGTATAEAIMSATETPLISECGGNNPCIIVPGDRPWTKKEIEHQAVQIATMAKFNGGANCGRPQTLVTSKHWPQRKEFLDALRVAISETTPAMGMYYPGADKVVDGFRQAYPDGAPRAASIRIPMSYYSQTSSPVATPLHMKRSAWCSLKCRLTCQPMPRTSSPAPSSSPTPSSWARSPVRYLSMRTPERPIRNYSSKRCLTWNMVRSPSTACRPSFFSTPILPGVEMRQARRSFLVAATLATYSITRTLRNRSWRQSLCHQGTCCTPTSEHSTIWLETWRISQSSLPG